MTHLKPENATRKSAPTGSNGTITVVARSPAGRASGFETAIAWAWARVRVMTRAWTTVALATVPSGASGAPGASAQKIAGREFRPAYANVSDWASAPVRDGKIRFVIWAPVQNGQLGLVGDRVRLVAISVLAVDHARVRVLVLVLGVRATKRVIATQSSVPIGVSGLIGPPVHRAAGRASETETEIVSERASA